ncbi:unnamed protein product [Ceratitis capitata]|uniref:(Mediterranean fruit fly) hypothetical protein n=2 Tax=Ceratitis capitata TaxID=7213 RepID=A0A811UQR6_CERCA|nr:unnamed protein product [Ceratitis capitata]
MGLTRISAAALLCYAITICWQTVNSEFTTEDCKQLNNTVNVTCTNDEINYYTVNFQNDAQFKIYITVDNETETNSITITCQGGDEDILRINKNLTKFSLQHHDFASITVDGCIPFEDILKGFEIKLSTDFKLQRGITSTSLKPEHLRNLAALSNLVLSGFEKLDEQIFANMKSLEKLELTRFEAPLPGGVLSAIGDNLVQLNMRDNRMHQPPERLFTPLNRLELLDLSFNKLQTIPSGTFDQLENLIELDLSENRIELLPADVFQSLRALARLYLANNRLKRLDLGTFSTLNNLQQLGIENNALEIAPIEACKIFDGLSKLDYLELSNNSLTTYCLPHNMSSVQVSVSYNQIRELLVPTGAHQPRQLTKLNVRHNRLEH